jgi:DNA-binding SARP family transcriptional activator
MALSIGLLGILVIERDDCRLGKVPKKARGLLGYLAAQGGQAVSRERLADLLWPYQGSEQARHSLRNCLLELRKALGPSGAGYLVADFANCRIQDVAVDLDRFERLSRSQNRAELEVAADLYRGEFLADFHIDSEPFQEWLAAERDRMLALICDILQRLTAAQDAAGEGDAAIQSGRRLVALDPLSEFGQRTLMRAYAHAGRRCANTRAAPRPSSANSGLPPMPRPRRWPMSWRVRAAAPRPRRAVRWPRVLYPTQTTRLHRAAPSSALYGLAVSGRH